jgi:ankyrin repeat protein
MGQAECCKILLENGAKSLEKDKSWASPLHWACVGGNVDVTRLLLKHMNDFVGLNSVDRRYRQSPVTLVSPRHAHLPSFG